MYRLLHSLIPRPNSLGMRLAVTELMAPENEWTMLPDFFDQMLQLLFFLLLVLCSFYSRAAFLSLEIPQTSTMAR